MPDPFDAERRAAPRRRTLKSGRAIFNNKQSVLSCTVRDLSATGAKLRFATVMGIPETFELDMTDEPRRSCHVVWRRGEDVGVVFV